MDSSVKVLKFRQEGSLASAECPKTMRSEKYLRVHKYGSERKRLCTESIEKGKWCSGAYTFFVLAMGLPFAWFFVNLSNYIETGKRRSRAWVLQCKDLGAPMPPDPDYDSRCATNWRRMAPSQMSDVSRCQYITIIIYNIRTIIL